MSTDAPQDLDELKARITNEHPLLSRRLQEVSHYVMDNPTNIALNTLTVIAKAAGVHPSTLVRFANAFGFAGFSDLQNLYKARLIEESPDYNLRIRVRSAQQSDAERPGVRQLLNEFGHANELALEGLLNEVEEAPLKRAIDLLAQAETIYLAGVRRAFPVSTYLHYTLSHIRRRCRLLDGIGGMLQEEGQFMRCEDVLIAVTYKPYGHEIRDLIALAESRGCKIILLTDSQLYPSAASADVLFIVKDAEVRAIRSLSATMCLAQTLCIGLAYELADQDT